MFLFLFLLFWWWLLLLFKLKSGKIVQRIKEPPKKTSFVVKQERSAVKLSFHEDIRYSAYPCHCK